MKAPTSSVEHAAHWLQLLFYCLPNPTAGADLCRLTSRVWAMFSVPPLDEDLALGKAEVEEAIVHPTFCCSSNWMCALIARCSELGSCLCHLNDCAFCAHRVLPSPASVLLCPPMFVPLQANTHCFSVLLSPSSLGVPPGVILCPFTRI